MDDTKVPRVKKFKYLGSTVQESGSCEREIKRRVQAGWNGWRKVSGVIYDRRLPVRVKRKVYSSVVRPAIMYGLEAVAITKKQVEEMEVAEMKMLRFATGVTRKDKIRNEYIRGTVKAERFGMKMREGRLKWYGHVMRTCHEERPGVRRKKGDRNGVTGKEEKREAEEKISRCSKRRYGGSCAREKDIKNRTLWRNMIRCGNP